MSAKGKLEELRGRIGKLKAEIARIKAEKSELNAAIDTRIQEETLSGKPYPEYEKDMQRLAGYDTKIRKAEVSLTVLEGELPKYDRAAREELAAALRKELRARKGAVESGISCAVEAMRSFKNLKEAMVQKLNAYGATMKEYQEVMESLKTPVRFTRPVNSNKEARILDHDDIRLENEAGMIECGVCPNPAFFVETDGIEYIGGAGVLKK